MTGDNGVDAHTPTIGRLGPWVNEDTRFFWDGTESGDLLIQQCQQCDEIRHPPGPMCPRCRCLQWTTIKASGRGTIYSYTVLHHPPAPGFDGPALGIVVALDEGVRLVSNLIAEVDEPVRIGDSVEVVFIPQSEGYTLPVFRRVGKPRADDADAKLDDEVPRHARLNRSGPGSHR